MKSTRSVHFFSRSLLVLLIGGLKPESSDRNSICLVSAAGLIVNGTVASADKWPWLAALSLEGSKTFFCAGSLLSLKFVLTAAHCLHEKKSEKPIQIHELIVYFGIWNLSEINDPNVVSDKPFNFIIHEEWNVSSQRYDADIALIQLSKAFDFSLRVKSVEIWWSDDKISPEGQRDVGVAVGW